MSDSGLELPVLIQSPLVRANVTLLELLAPPLCEDRRPLRSSRFPPAAKNRRDAGNPLWGVKTLGGDIRKRLLRGYPNETEMSILDGLVSEVLADVSALHDPVCR
jgi:hypothetical protein